MPDDISDCQKKKSQNSQHQAENLLWRPGKQSSICIIARTISCCQTEQKNLSWDSEDTQTPIGK